MYRGCGPSCLVSQVHIDPRRTYARVTMRVTMSAMHVREIHYSMATADGPVEDADRDHREQPP